MEDCWFKIVSLFIGLIGTGGTIFLVWKACQKPKARFRFADGKKEITLSPHYYNETLKYYVVPYPDLSQFDKYHDLGERYQKLHEKDNRFLLTFRLSNTGAFQLENYRVEISFDGGIHSYAPTTCKPRRVIGNYIESAEPEDLQLQGKKPQVIFESLEKTPLNQNDSREFSIRITPHSDAERVELNWRIIAKDFSDKGKFVIHLKPTVTHYTNIQPVYTLREIPEGAERVEDLTPYIKEWEELLKQ